MTGDPRMHAGRRGVAPLVAGIGASLFVASCGISPSGGALPTSITNPLPTLRPDSVAHAGCRVVELVDAVLVRDSDPEAALIVRVSGPAGRYDLVWPPGYGVRSYRFGGDIDIIDAAGAVAYTEGGSVDRACLAGPPDDPDATLILAGGE